MDMRQLRLFAAVAEELHFGRAAARLHLSQPALSYQIARLEEDLQVGLFNRTSRKVELTVAGRTLLDGIPQLLDDVDRLARLTQRASTGEAGHVRVGFVGTTMLTLVPEVVRAMKTNHPSVELTLREHRTTDLVTALIEGRLDVAFLYNLETEYDGLTVTHVAGETVGIALPDTHNLTSRSVIRIEELAADDFVFFPRDLGPDNYDRLVEHCVLVGFKPRVVQEAENLSTILGLVAAGLGVAFASETVMANLQRQSVHFVRLESPPTVGVGLAHRTEISNPAVDRFIEAVTEVLARAKRPTAAV